MADQKLTELDEETSPAGTDMLYVVTDPDGSPTSKKVKIENLPRGGDIEASDEDLLAFAAATVVSEARVDIEARNTENAEWRSSRLGLVAADGSASLELMLEAGSTQAAVVVAEVEDNGPFKMAFGAASPVAVPIPFDSGDTLENRVAALEAALVALGLLEDTA